MPSVPYAELHSHSHFSFLDGASPPDELIDRAVQLGLTGLAITDHQGLYGVVRFANAAREAGLRPIVGVEIELVDALVADPGGIVDGEGRVRGAERLVVADASVFPTSLGVNPQVTIMAFASRAAEAILRRW